jgi:hypothetical protein
VTRTPSGLDVHRFVLINHVVVMSRSVADAHPASVAALDDLFADGLAFLGAAAR